MRHIAVLLATGEHAQDEGIWQGRRRRHIDWWECSAEVAARRSLGHSHEPNLVIFAVGLNHMTRCVEALVKGLASYRLSDKTTHVHGVSKRGGVLPDPPATIHSFLGDSFCQYGCSI